MISIFFFGYFFVFVLWVVIKDDKIFPCPCEQFFLYLNKTCEWRIKWIKCAWQTILFNWLILGYFEEPKWVKKSENFNLWIWFNFLFFFFGFIYIQNAIILNFMRTWKNYEYLSWCMKKRTIFMRLNSTKGFGGLSLFMEWEGWRGKILEVSLR